MAYYSGLYNGLIYKHFAVSDSDGEPIIGAVGPTPEQGTGILGADAFIDDMVSRNKQDAIVAIFMVPQEFRNYEQPAYPKETPFLVERPDTLNGHIVRNKKLLTYPYNFACVDTGNDAKIYKYEYFQKRINPLGIQQSWLLMYGIVSPSPALVIVPENYNGTSSVLLEGAVNNNTESVIASDFPLCAFIIDAYKAWLAQRDGLDALSIMASAMSLGGAVASGNPVLMGQGIANFGSSIISTFLNSTKGSKTRGGSGGLAEVGARTKGVYLKQMCVNKNYAATIDSFFDRYGYACEKIKIPNRNVRESWTYCKTRDCAVHGTVPAEALEKIKNIYNKGITWWNKDKDVGNYGQSNNVLSAKVGSSEVGGANVG